jgi:hypothetical protein
MGRNFDPEKSDTENLCDALESVAYALDQLGFGRGSSGTGGPGAIEGHTMMMRDKIVPQICQAIESGFERLAEAIESRGAK